jgi:uncharacterized protein (TIGR03066 family)
MGPRDDAALSLIIPRDGFRTTGPATFLRPPLAGRRRHPYHPRRVRNYLTTREKLMRIPRLCLTVAVALLVLSAAWADDKPKDLLVGKWQSKEKVGDTEVMTTIDFQKDGKLKIEAAFGDKKVNIDGKYNVVDDNTIETEVTSMGETKKEKSKFTVTKDKLVMEDKNNKKTEFTRVK